MAKYSTELKLKIVKEYLEGKVGYETLAKKYNITTYSSIKIWVKRYEIHGEKGLLKNLKTSYDGNFKLSVIQYMHENHLSAHETGAKFNIGHDVILKWERIYYKEGLLGLHKERRGRPNKSENMTTKSHKKISKELEEDLIEEVQQLRMENAYLKKLNALVQERTKPKQQKK